jgi:hypothetical protein
MKKCYLFHRFLLLFSLSLVFLVPRANGQFNKFSDQYKYTESFEDAGPIQIGLKTSWIMPRNEFGMDFKRAPGYELYYQFRNDGGDGRWTARGALFYANFKPRMDTIPSYMVREFPTTKIFPGYISYKKLYFIGIGIEYAYSAVHYNNFRLDVGLGMIGGQFHREYEEEYATILTSRSSVDEYFAGLRAKVSAGYQLNKYIEIYMEGMDAFMSQLDWSSQYNYTSLGLGINVSLKPNSNED